MGMTLYHGEPNGPSFTVLAALFEKDLEAELVRLDLGKGERHGSGCPHSIEVEMSIEGEGPVLAVDGEALADSAFIACYFDDVGGGTPLRPADPYGRWEVMTWCRQIIERCAPAAALLGNHALFQPVLAAMDEVAFADLVAPIRSDDLRQRWLDTRAGHFPDAHLADSRDKIAQTVAKVETRLNGRDWLMGAFSLADLESYAWLAGMVALVPDAFAAAPRTMAWLGRVRARPAVQRALARASVDDPRRAWAPGPEINRWG